MTLEAEVSLRVDDVVDAPAFVALEGEWTRLLTSSLSSSLFLTWEWLHAWWTHLRGEARLALLTVRRGQELLAIAPFVSHGASLLGSPRLSFMGEGRIGSDYLDVIVRHGAEEPALAALAARLARTGATLRMRQLRTTTSAGARLARKLRLLGCRVRATRTHRCPYIALEGGSFEAYLATLGSEHRYNFQRKLRKLKGHAMRFERVSTEARRLELLPLLFELHGRRWSERGGSDGLAGPGIPEFHDTLTRVALERGWLRLYVLWLGDTPAATFYGFRYGRVFSFYQSGFDPQFAKLSVGLVSLGLAIESAIDEGAGEFDLLHGVEAYKFHWAKATRRLGGIEVFPPGPLGRLAWASSAATRSARRAAHHLPPGVVAAISAARAGAAR